MPLTPSQASQTGSQTAKTTRLEAFLGFFHSHRRGDDHFSSLPLQGLNALGRTFCFMSDSTLEAYNPNQSMTLIRRMGGILASLLEIPLSIPGATLRVLAFGLDRLSRFLTTGSFKIVHYHDFSDKEVPPKQQPLELRLLTQNMALLPRQLWTLARSRFFKHKETGVLSKQGVHGVSLSPKERVELFLKNLAAAGEEAPHIFCLQEAFDRKAQQQLMTALKKKYPYMIAQAGARSPFSIGLNSGLMIFSQFPLEEVEYHHYDNALGLDEYIASKGFVTARAKMPDGSYYRLYTTHTQAGAGFAKKLMPSVKTGDALPVGLIDRIQHAIRYRSWKSLWIPNTGGRGTSFRRSYQLNAMAEHYQALPTEKQQDPTLIMGDVNQSMNRWNKMMGISGGKKRLKDTLKYPAQEAFFHAFGVQTVQDVGRILPENYHDVRREQGSKGIDWHKLLEVLWHNRSLTPDNPEYWWIGSDVSDLKLKELSPKNIDILLEYFSVTPAQAGVQSKFVTPAQAGVQSKVEAFFKRIQQENSKRLKTLQNIPFNEILSHSDLAENAYELFVSLNHNLKGRLIDLVLPYQVNTFKTCLTPRYLESQKPGQLTTDHFGVECRITLPKKSPSS